MTMEYPDKDEPKPLVVETTQWGFTVRSALPRLPELQPRFRRPHPALGCRMDADEFYSWGEPIAQADLRTDLSRAMVQAVAKYPFAEIVEVRRDGEREAIVVDFEAEIPQQPPVPIQSRERLAVVVSPEKNTAPLACDCARTFLKSFI